MADLVDRARAAVTDRAELPGMSLMEHLDELRKRLIRSVIYLLLGFMIAYAFHERLYGVVSRPIDMLNLQLNFTHPTDGLNLYLKTSLVGGAILASPFILYQIWLFIAPGMYSNEKRYVVPFMTATVALFMSGVFFGYYWVLPGALKVLIGDFGRRFHPIITIEDYTSFFLAVILGLGITFELPILIFFLSILGIVDAKFLIRHIRYAILVIFIIAAIICPLPDPVSMCLFAMPMLVLYMVGVGVAWIFNPARRKEAKSA
ncbi:twin-arginine translocase subunit TatC [Edaphobacter albus]|uniref:twin-arginine translocase subunit TatC n=1 Tax=Edaphobacter sp. 4G125 TaxID=2763071 RepID=UPI00164638AB|nr:twin-arginine translocase subunit TatC [Edaphobacter sp. 4G125]QNI38036.1 twin-arginine translocase subunit TatC [Edaphobacter sp. 4G125]